MTNNKLTNLASFQNLYRDIDDGKNIYLNGIIYEATGHFLLSLSEDKNRPVFVVCENDKKARNLYDELSKIRDSIYLFPELDLNFHGVENFDYANKTHRIKSIKSIIDKENSIIISYPQALIFKFNRIEKFKNNIININYEIEIDPTEMAQKLINIGYKRVDMVEAKGEFAIRGDIIDVFQIQEDNPIRIELFDTEIDSIRIFDINDQLSIDQVDEVSIYPINELTLDNISKDEIIKNILNDIDKTKKVYGDIAYDKASSKYLALIDDIKNDVFQRHIDLLLPYIDQDLSCITDYFNEQTITVFLDFVKIINSQKDSDAFLYEQNKYGIETGFLLASHIKAYFTSEEIVKNLKQRQYINLSTVFKHFRNLDFDSILEIKTREIESFYGRWSDFLDFIKFSIKEDKKVIILSKNDTKINSIKKDFQDYNIPIESDFDENKNTFIMISSLDLQKGFEYIDDKIIFITDEQIFGTSKSKKNKSKKIINKRDFLNYTDLEIGDYVVHENYGVGKYLGIKNIEVQDSRTDFLEIAYNNGDKLFIPTTDMAIISKFVGNVDKEPKLSKLYTSEWAKTTQRAKKAIDKIAENLVELYAKRAKIKGFAFSKDTPWQKEFEDSFIYEETQAQLRAIDEIKGDMELDLPMDRLLCGDVGYGKTEVAFRAAFKAIMDGKQVIMLAPTTILVKQHFKNMVERFKGFPMDMDYISRFKTPKQKEVIKEKLRKGQLDFVVGTHALLADSIKFKDLGLLIIDEEQRFGVKHKEKIKEMSEEIDVLTLSATPIPRTLQMSLSGIREMSLLDIPPENRLPINTFVMEYEPAVIRTAILKELSRGGQVYFVFNRVNGIETMKRHLQELVPEANIAITHGKMSTNELDKVLESFVSGEVDILLTTTIIETGMDIQNVNTIIVYNADMMGLSQLYQLKGRIGRSDRSAYAYFTFEKYKSITDIAEKRLMAIKDFNELGSGYKIAMRDLELRGAGNLLGESQSGHIESIGYDLYVRMLKESIDSIKGVTVKKKSNVKIDVKIDAYIPDSYIANQSEKINMYKKISYIENEKEYMDVIDELIDRFGNYPKSVENLLDIALIRALLEDLNFDEMVQVNDEINFVFKDFTIFEMKNIETLSKVYDKFLRYDFLNEKKIIIKKDKSFIKNSKILLKLIKEIKEGEVYEKN